VGLVDDRHPSDLLPVRQSTLLVIDRPVKEGQHLCTLLIDLGYCVQAVPDEHAAIVAGQVQRPDLIVLSREMPWENLSQACHLLKSDTTIQATPLLVIGSEQAAAPRAKLFEAGAADYLLRPFAPEELLAKVETQLRLSRLEQEWHQQQQTLQQEQQNRRVVELELQQITQEMQQLVAIDRLTQVANRDRLLTCLAQEWRRLSREQSPLSLLLFDVDNFRYFNVTAGHAAGDAYLCNVAAVMRSRLKRPADLVARYSGDEFAVLLPNTPLDGAVEVAKSIQASVQALYPPQLNQPLLTFSVGIASIIPSTDRPPDYLFGVVNEALQQAKLEGGDRIVTREISPFATLDYLIRNQIGLE